jgi:hypothetical protein
MAFRRQRVNERELSPAQLAALEELRQLALDKATRALID